MKKIEESLLILRKIALDIGYRTVLLLKGDIFNGLKEEKVGPRTTLFTTLIGMNIIDACSYLEEYEKIFGVITEKEYSDRALLVKSISKPVVKEIKKWSDLINIRNWMLAHNLRINKGKMLYNQAILDYNVPTTIYEIELLSHCIQIINHIIVNEFDKELEEASNQEIAKTKEREFFTKEQCWNIVDQLIESVNRKVREYNKDYCIDLKKDKR